MISVVPIILCFVILLFGVWWWWLSPRGEDPPMYPGKRPIVGHAYLLENLLKFWDEEMKLYNYTLKNGGLVQVRIASHVLYALTDPDECLHVANTCLEKSFLYQFGKEVYGRGLITAEVSSWKLHRKLLNPAFKQQVLKSFMQEYNALGRRIVSQLSSEVGKGPIEILPDLILNTLETVYRTSMGVETSTNREIVKSYADATYELFNLYFLRVQKFWLHFPLIYHFSSLKKQENKLGRFIRDTTHQVINNHRLALKSGNHFGNSFDKSDKFKPLLDHMLDLTNQQNAFTEDEIVDHLGTMIVAAYDTTAICLNFVLLCVGSYPKVQERIIEELKSVIGDGDGHINKDDLAKLVYLEAVVKETLRLYPPAPRIARTTKSDFKLRNYTLKANSTIIISVYGINRYPMWGADADQFRPERWLDPASLPENPNAFATFSLGRRNCIGKLYAIMVIKLTLAHILRAYRVTADVTKLQCRADFVQKSVDGHQVAFEIRK